MIKKQPYSISCRDAQSFKIYDIQIRLEGFSSRLILNASLKC